MQLTKSQLREKRNTNEFIQDFPNGYPDLTKRRHLFPGTKKSYNAEFNK